MGKLKKRTRRRYGAEIPSVAFTEADGAGFEPAKPYGYQPCTPLRQSSVYEFPTKCVTQRLVGALPLSYSATVDFRVAPVGLEPTTSGV